MRFRTVKVPVSREEKLRRAREYNEYCGEGECPVDPEEFAGREAYEEYVDMKCLGCGYEERQEADMVLECLEMEGGDYPRSYCPECGRPDMVPKDIYEEMKGKKKAKKARK